MSLYIIHPLLLYIVQPEIRHLTYILELVHCGTKQCRRGFEDMKNGIISSLKASDILGLIFY